MPLKIKSAKRDDLDHLKVIYDVLHSTPGEKGTTLSLDLTLSIQPAGPVVASMNIQGPACATTEGALDKLAEWLERSAEAIRKRPQNWVLQIPVYPE